MTPDEVPRASTRLLLEEYKRRWPEVLAQLGPRPPWWRRRQLRLWRLRARHLQAAHFQDLVAMLAAATGHEQAIRAMLVGWSYPPPYWPGGETTGSPPDA